MQEDRFKVSRAWLQSFSAILAMSFCCQHVSAKDWLLPKDQQRPYSVIKAELLAQGWKPFQARHFDIDSYCGLDGQHCREFPETLWCQEAGKPSCTMGLYKSSPRRYLVVRGTLAEIPSETMAVDEIVTPTKEFIARAFFRTAP